LILAQNLAGKRRDRAKARVFTPVPDTHVPHTIASLDLSQLQRYTTQQRVILRTVFAMINGQRSVSQMKESLRLSSEAINEALTSLKAIGVIE
jgi:3-methyladenine DNA glycosylase/8-oxoguanine DNA glycosylase